MKGYLLVTGVGALVVQQGPPRRSPRKAARAMSKAASATPLAKAVEEEEDCGCETVYGGDASAAARTLVHFDVVASTEILDAEKGAATTVLDPSYDGVAVVAFLRSFG